MKIDGVTEIEADITSQTCTFKVKPGVDYETKLAAFVADESSKLFEGEIQ